MGLPMSFKAAKSLETPIEKPVAGVFSDSETPDGSS